MAWLPKGNCYAFCESSILAYAPQTSGVYGLYNFDYQLYIGDSPNIRATLLQHLRETDDQPLCYQPTGFAFESCSIEQSAIKAQRLIAEHQPVRQAEWPSVDSWETELEEAGRPSYEFAATAVDLGNGRGLSTASEKPAVSGDRRFYFVRGQVAALTVMFAISLVVIFFLGFLTGERLQQKANAVYESPLVRFSHAADADEPSSEKPHLADRGSATAAPTPTGNSSSAAAQKPKGAVDALASEKAIGEPLARREYAVSAPLTPARATYNDLNAVTHLDAAAHARTVSVADHSAVWSVQLAAHRQRALTENQVASLKNRGYEAYIVETERDGQVWYRVRIGRFATRAEAEALQGILESREGYRNPFITRD